MTDFNHATAEEIELLFSPNTIRKRCGEIFARTQEGQTHFHLHLEKLSEVARYVADVTLENYPDLNIPFHSRWNHFNVGGFNRCQELNLLLSKYSTAERTRCKLDLVVVSVLLDAGAGSTWRYREEKTKKEWTRSEGLAVASLHMFLAGAFSSDPKFPLRVDAEKLCSIQKEEIQKGFQVNDSNPLVGIEGRTALLQNLGRALLNNKKLFDGKIIRVGNLLDYFSEQFPTGKLPAVRILRAVQDGFGPIWPARLHLNGINMGDVWPYAPFGQGTRALVPFHKLSQWMTYSLFEPLLEGGLHITHTAELTGLAEYRNGGLMLDSGLLTLKNAADIEKTHLVNSELIVEWRALTVCLLDLLGTKVTKILGKKPQEFPLPRVLEGGTWWAGRKLAQKLRGGVPPFQIESDGTVF